MREYLNKLGMERVRSKNEKVIAQWRRNHRCVGCWCTPTKQSSMNLTATCAFHPPICAWKSIAGPNPSPGHAYDMLHRHARDSWQRRGLLSYEDPAFPSPGVRVWYIALYAFPRRFETLCNSVMLSPTCLFATQSLASSIATPTSDS